MSEQPVSISAVAWEQAGPRAGRPWPAAAVALFEHLTGPMAENPYRLGKHLDAPLEELRSTRRGEYRALYFARLSRAARNVGARR